MKKRRILAASCCIMALAFVAMALPFAAPEKEGTFCQVTTGEEIHAGWLVCVWTNGLAYGADDTAAYTVIGRAESSVASGSDLLVKGGIYRYDNEGSFADKDIGSAAYMWTNTTHYSIGTAAAASHNVKAGTIVDVDSSGVWIDTRRQ